MEWYRNLYVGQMAKKKRDRLIQKIESGKAPVNVYLITLPGTEANQLEIVPVWNLKFWNRGRTCPLIVGLACGRGEALELLVQITEEVLEETGTVNLRARFEAGQNREG